MCKNIFIFIEQTVLMIFPKYLKRVNIIAITDRYKSNTDR